MNVKWSLDINSDSSISHRRKQSLANYQVLGKMIAVTNMFYRL